MLANSQERFQVFAEHDFFAGPGIAPNQPLRDGPCRRRRTHRIAGITMLAAAVGTVAGGIGFTWLPGIHRRPPGSVRVAARVERADRPARQDALASRPQRERRAQARRRSRGSSVRVVAHAVAPVARAVGVRRPHQGPGHRGSSLRTRTVRHLAIAREDTRTPLARAPLASATEPVAEPRTPTHSAEFGFER